MLKTQISPNFKARRQKLLAENSDATFILFSGHEAVRNNDVHHPFRPDSSFYYLTGFDEPDAVLVLNQNHGVLFVLARDAEREMWEGERYGTDGALRVFGMDESYVSSEFERMLPTLLMGTSRVGYRLGLDEARDRKVLRCLDQVRAKMGRSGQGLIPLFDPYLPIGEMRLFKDSEEIDLMRRSCQITAESHVEVMKQVRPGMNEFEVEAIVNYEFTRRGCRRLGYGSIVAGGKNASCLHYRANNEVLKDGDLLLIDAGGEYEMFSADITRTFPVGRAFTPAQAKIYDLVLKSQLAGIELAKPGSTQVAIHQRCTEVLVDGMLSLGFLTGKADEIVAKSLQKRFYPHNTGHWLGMDVHDSGLYQKNGEPRKLEPGMVFTIEPGFYVQPGDFAQFPEYANIGIRIEDDILITDKGCEVMTRAVPKERAQIEALKK